MKTLAKNAFCGLYKYSGLMRVQETISSWAGKSSMTIILFHRVTDEVPEDGITVNTRWFRGFCELIQKRFRPVPLQEIVRYSKSKERPPKRLVAVTFDDCYRDNLPAAHVLAEHGIPATFFIPTKFVGTDTVFPWDKDLPRMANLTWDEIREMVSLGHDIGSHSVSHPNMAELNDEEAMHELVESRRTLEEKLQRPIRYFAHPFGQKNHLRPNQLRLIEKAGYEAVFSAFGGFVYPGMKQPILPREGVPYFRSLLNLELHMTGCLDWMYTLKRKVGILA